MNYSPELSEALSRLIANHPFYASLLFAVGEVVETGTIKTAATDGKNVYINPIFFNRLPIKQRTFILKHEIWHIALSHIPRTQLYRDRGFGPDLKPFNPHKMNKAEDYIVNDIIVEEGEDELPPMALHDKRIATYESIADEVYSAVGDDDEEENFDDHMPPNPDAPSQQEVQSAVSSARAAARAAGKYSSVMDTLIGEILEPQVTWAEQLKSRVQEIAGNTDSTWSRINRRKVASPVNAVVLPSSTGYAAGDIGITIDVSGSISDRELQVFLSEAHGLFSEVQPRSLTLFWVDTEVLRVDRIEDIEDLVNIKGVRGGGTHMPVVFDYVADEMIPLETMIFLTDGYTDFGDEQPYEVIWCITTNKKASHGTTIPIKT